MPNGDGKSRKILRRCGTRDCACAYPGGAAPIQVLRLDEDLRDRDRRVADDNLHLGDRLHVDGAQRLDIRHLVDEDARHEDRHHAEEYVLLEDRLHVDHDFHVDENVQHGVGGLSKMKSLRET